MIDSKSWINRFSHSIKIYLSRHISIQYLKLSAFLVALFSCLSCGSILLFSLYSVSIHEMIGMSYLQINFIASLSAIGMYLCLPVLGYLSDCYGPSLLAMLSIWLFVPSYFFCSRIVRSATANIINNGKLEHGEDNRAYLYAFGVCFFFIGLATSSMYFSSLLTCAKIYPKYKGIAISLPVSCYGMSSLILSQLMKLDYFHTLGKSLDLVRVFSFYVWLYLVVGVLNFVACSIVSIESEVIFGDENDSLTREDQNGYGSLSEGVSNDHIATSGSLNKPQQGDETEEDSDTFLPSREVVEPRDHHERYIAFLKDPSAWVLLVSLVLNLGPMESFQNNLGSIITNVSGYDSHVDLSNQVSVLATSSTFSRLLLGMLSDYISSTSRKYPICKVWILLAIIFIGALGQLIPISSAVSGQKFGVISAINGFSYGGLFTIYPTIIASIWGIDIMGSTWGSFMIAPAIGSIGFSLLYGNQVDSKCRGVDEGNEGFSSCLFEYFAFTSGGLVVSFILVVIVWRAFWCKRGFTLF
ncbi:probable transporter Mch1p [[Candida] railenensis]|uniref:Probable transporter MCH1 n=1 Tax=[Candida] railenensis TaxID=45579 RepID=A0A9P0W053_9ASCO|nr:probable transporter Mch1p [[Candida] railenensis]